MKQLRVSASPHAHCGLKTAHIMLCMLLALLPAAITGCLYFGFQAAELLVVTTLSAVLTELLTLVIRRRPYEITDGSAVVTGLLLGMTLPPDVPIWQGAVGSAIAVVIVKQLFGGIGKNITNPALTARIAMMLAFTQSMTTFRAPGSDIVSTILPESASFWDMLLGNTAGCIGETCAIGLILGGVFLMLMRVITPAIPLAYLGSFALFSLLGGFGIVHELLSGGILLAAFFMATDPVTTPLTEHGKVLFGIGCGCITFVIRHYGGYQEGAVYAVVIMNLLTPAIDRISATMPFGAAPVPKQKKQSKKAASAS